MRIYIFCILFSFVCLFQVLQGQSLSMDTAIVQLMPQAFDEWIEVTVSDSRSEKVVIRNIVLERLKQSRYTSTEALLIASETLIDNKRILSEPEDSILLIIKKDSTVLEQVEKSMVYIDQLVELLYKQKDAEFKLLSRKVYFKEIYFEFYKTIDIANDIVNSLENYVDSSYKYWLEIELVELESMLSLGNLYKFSFKNYDEAESVFLELHDYPWFAINDDGWFFKRRRITQIAQMATYELYGLYYNDLYKLMSLPVYNNMLESWLEAIKNLGGDVNKYYEIHYPE